MKITIRQDETVNETELTVVCRQMDVEIEQILTATLMNGEKLVVSRQYIGEIKKKLGV